jgi:LCP family protein required for cell wall assembly
MKEKPEKKKFGILKVLLIVLLVLFLFFAAVVGVLYGYYRSKVDKLQADPPMTETISPSEESVISSEAQDLVDAMESVLQEETLPTVEVTEATVPVKEDGDVINILLIGTDERVNNYSTNARGDACLLFSVNTHGDHPVVSLVSFERGMGVPILSGQYQGQWDWLTHTFRYGGAELMLREIQECFKVDVDYYVRVNLKYFEDGIDAIGGVDVYFDEVEADYFRAGHGAEIYAGMNHLNGELALNYARLREIDSDWQRIQRQREVIFSALNQVKQMDLGQIDALIDTLLGMVRTNLPEEVITKLILLAPSLPDAEFQQMTIPQKGTYGGMKGMDGRPLFAVDFETNAKILHDFIYPHLKDSN